MKRGGGGDDDDDEDDEEGGKEETMESGANAPRWLVALTAGKFKV